MLRRLKDGEYTITQAWDFSVNIYKDGRRVFHAIRHERCDDNELLEILKIYKEIRKGEI